MRWREVPQSERDEVAALNKERQVASAELKSIPKAESGIMNRAWLEKNDHDFNDPAAWIGRSEQYVQAAARVSDLDDEIAAVMKSYFRFNVSGMSRAVDIMLRLGMCYNDEMLTFPTLPADSPATWDDVHALGYPDDPAYDECRAAMTPEARADAEAYNTELARVLAFHSQADTPGIPEHKFSSNDGWLVVPAECEAAVSIWNAALAEHGEAQVRTLVTVILGESNHDYWLDWIQFMADAARHGGFVVR